MGSEFLNRTKPTIIKHIDTKRAALSTPDMFTNQPQEQPRCSIASLANDATLSQGEKVIVEKIGGNLSLRRGNSVIGSLDSPSKDELKAVEQSGGAANGVVQRVHKLAKKVEVALC